MASCSACVDDLRPLYQEGLDGERADRVAALNHVNELYSDVRSN